MSHMPLLILCVIVSLSLVQAQPPGIPPVQIHADGHGPPGDVSGHSGHMGGFGNQPHDAEHIKEHLKDVVDKPKESMTEDELEFHYFKLHDYDNNNKLDGTEITKAITHFHAEEEEKTEDQGEKPDHHDSKIFTDEEIMNIVDMVLKEDDLNEDGYIEYVEFVTAQRKARGNDGK